MRWLRTRSSCYSIFFIIAIFLLVAPAAGQIKASFFGMGAVAPTDLPQVSYGTLSHPPLAWTLIEGTARGVFDFSKMDGFVNGAPKDANGVAQIDLVLGWTPAWAVSVQTHCWTHYGQLVCTVPPDNLKDWTDFITALVAHYNGVMAPHVQYYEIWCEANSSEFWTASAGTLANMAKLAYPILKLDPYSEVVTPSVVWPGGTTFLTRYLNAGGAKYADAMSFHGYPSKTFPGAKTPIPLPESTASTNAPIQTMLTTYRALADTSGMAGKPLITTEGGWGEGGVTDPDEQVAWLAQYEIVQAGLAATVNLQSQSWFTWGQAASGTIENSDGKPNAAGLAHQEVMAWLVGSRPLPCTSVGSIWSCVVHKKLIVWDASKACSNGRCSVSLYTPPLGYTKYVTLNRDVWRIRGAIALGVKPILLEP